MDCEEYSEYFIMQKENKWQTVRIRSGEIISKCKHILVAWLGLVKHMEVQCR